MSVTNKDLKNTIQGVERKEYFNILFLFLATRVVLFGIALIASHGDLSKAFYNFDIDCYLDIALHGYTKQTSAFFPLIPLLMKAFNVIGIPVAGVMIINNVLTFFSAILLYKLTNNFNSVKLFLCSPIAVFTFIAYTESIFLFLTLLVVYLYKQEKYLLAGVFLGLSVTCRNLAAMLFFAIFIVMAIKFFQKKLSAGSIFAMYIPATLISLIYPIFLQIKFGNWKIFMDVQFTDWHRISSNIFSTIFHDIIFITTTDSPIQAVQIVYQFILLVLMIVLIVFSIKKLFQTRDEVTAISILYLILSIFCIYSTCRIPEISIPSASFYRYFYGCISVYLLPTIFNSEKFESIKETKMLGLDIGLSACFALCYFSNVFMC